MQKKQFKIGTKKYFVDELDITQDELLTDIISELEIGQLMDMKVEKIFKAIASKKLLRRFLAILLIPVNSEFDEKKISAVEQDVKKMKNSQAIEVLQDFLSKNKESLNKLKDFLGDLLPTETVSPVKQKLEELSRKTPS
jgi:hypothetical protein